MTNWSLIPKIIYLNVSHPRSIFMPIFATQFHTLERIHSLDKSNVLFELDIGIKNQILTTAKGWKCLNPWDVRLHLSSEKWKRNDKIRYDIFVWWKKPTHKKCIFSWKNKQTSSYELHFRCFPEQWFLCFGREALKIVAFPRFVVVESGPPKKRVATF